MTSPSPSHAHNHSLVSVVTEWSALVSAEVRARDFDYLSTDFVRSVFVVYAHDSILISATRWMYLHGTSTFSTVGEFP